MERAVRALPVFAGPILILFIRRIVQVFSFLLSPFLQKTLLKQRAKVENIKKKTDFYSTRALLSRYCASTSGSPAASTWASARGGKLQTPERGLKLLFRCRGPTRASEYSEPTPEPTPAVRTTQIWFDTFATSSSVPKTPREAKVRADLREVFCA
ncbi:hypothetical protein B0H16DRAFT_1718568 [Mycena metata]|uniref:Uncharacterized protein n=1 Tax=Mycena metata TaxID=1033252 RepID=A0AAD7JH80_9AGAR|nr:hypothetical protein B0H16DRAFT_1718568 [Mycena metata]